MPLKANGCHNHLKLKIKASSVIFLLFWTLFSVKILVVSIKKLIFTTADIMIPIAPGQSLICAVSAIR